MTDPIVYEFEVDATPGHAFRTWTERCALWWPSSHRMSESETAAIVFEPRVGGRIFERDVQGTEHEWGRIEEWDPPNRLAYLWHIFLEADRATRVDVSFSRTESGTKVRLENSGFDIFGDGAGSRSERVATAWEAILAVYRGSF